MNYSGTHHIGKTGIERFYEDALHGQVGYEEVETNARGRVRVLKRTDPKPGKDIVLSLDIKLQEAAEAALGGRRAPWWRWTRALARFWPWSASQASIPTCSSPASASRRMPSCVIRSTGRCSTACCAACTRRAPPSPAVAIAGLDSGVVNASSRVFDPGYYQLPNYDHKYRNWNRSGDGWVDLDTAIMRSNDTYFTTLPTRWASTGCPVT